MAENFMETDKKPDKDSKRRFNFMLGRHSHSLGRRPTSMDSLSIPM
jgi:hypothetical protein